jgi:predicted DNA-binding protein YlxM (UPF0122 family)
MKRLNKTQIEEIKKLYENGKSLIEIAEDTNFSITAIRYHCLEKEKINRKNYARKYYSNLSNEQKKELQNKQKEYQREYHRKRYKEDKNFREKQIERTKQSRKLKRGN